MAVKTWVWVVVGVAAVLVLGFLALVGAGVFVFFRQVDIESVTPETAELSFDEVRAKFAGQEPFIELTGEGADRTVRVIRRDRLSADEPETLHVMAWDPDDDRLVRIRFPMWLLRLGNNGTINFSENDFDLENLDLTVEDLDAHGPGLILDFEDDDSERVLVWTE